MSDKEKIQRELDMLARDLHAMRDAYLIRIMRNKRLPLSERYAALMQYEGQFSQIDDLSDESLLREINQSLFEIDRKPL
jgi:hypothetical protein